MSNDLISRSAVYNKLVELEELARNRVLDTPTNSPCYQRYVSQLNERTALKHLIADEPTAYDVDKVVERLEDKAKGRLRKSTSPFDNWAGMAVAYKDSVSIVKAGGKDDGRCRRN